MSIATAKTAYKSPAYIPRELFEWLRDKVPFPPKFRAGMYRTLTHPEDEVGRVTRLPKGAALLLFTRMDFACHDCQIVWHIDDLDERLHREVPCPVCEKIIRNHIYRYCVQGYYEWDGYIEAKEIAERESRYWSSVDRLEKKQEFTPYERMSRRRSAEMRRGERAVRNRE